MNLYAAFDPFLTSPTWCADWTGDDLLRFHRALYAVINEAGFDPDQMGRYLRQKVGVPDDDGKVNPLAWKIEELVAMAHAVRDFLNVNRVCGFTIFDG